MNDETDIAFIAYLQGYEAGRDAIKVERDKYKAEMETLEIKVAELDQAYRICAVDWKHEQSEANRYKAERDELIIQLESVLGFVMEGWPMPLGYASISGQAIAAINKIKEG